MLGREMETREVMRGLDERRIRAPAEILQEARHLPARHAV